MAAARQDRRGGLWCRRVAAANPEAILNVTFGADLVKLVARRQHPWPLQGSLGRQFS